MIGPVYHERIIYIYGTLLATDAVQIEVHAHSRATLSTMSVPRKVLFLRKSCLVSV